MVVTTKFLDGPKLNMVFREGVFFGTFAFLIYTNDLPNLIKITSLPVLFADDTSILFAQSNLTELNNNMNSIFEIVNDWFRVNQLALNFD
jgi:hypothetical protein